jgi:hypothetical protein
MADNSASLPSDAVIGHVAGHDISNRSKATTGKAGRMLITANACEIAFVR